MRVTTAFNRVLALDGTRVVSVAFTDDGLVLGVRRSARLHRCPCGRKVRGRYDVSTRRWRHVDFGATKVWLEASLARVACPACAKVRTEAVPWARPGARFTQDLENLIGWLAQRMDKTSVSKLLRCSWESVDRAVVRVVAEHLDDSRLDGLYRICVDEISYKRGHWYLTVVADHDTGRVVWVRKDRTKEAFEEFFTTLGPERTSAIEAISSDASSIYLPVAKEQIPQAKICLDPFHVITWVNEAMDSTYAANPAPTPTGQDSTNRGQWQKLRTSLRMGAERLDDDRRATVNRLRRERYRVFRAWELKEKLRDLYRTVEPEHAGRTPALLADLRTTLQTPRVQAPRPTTRAPLPRNRQRRRARPVQLQSRRDQRQDPRDPTPRLRPRQPRLPHRHDPPLPRRNQPPATHTKVRRRTCVLVYG
ncbi:ISL3 family transposase [Ornithinimicrobium faecis]|uniref:ISL3 family transposase n=1 Tax=Ornithinimicrobium faecis TaxID=2934158 RepID=A0ABY4YU99_9MICO|nr:ISL3 family transposase [Ornithinimicrobium sp. HY1793]USQ80196.1 ISL3 family transposase [Ornithinimicrobium sp. HY1793]